MSYRIFIVEDQKLTRVMLSMLIEQKPGYRVVGWAGSAEEALHLLPDAKPHLILLDLGLPGMNGIEAIRRMKRIHPDVEILILTIFDRDEAVFQSLKAGASGYLLKDSTPDDIAAAIDLLLKHNGAPMSPVIARRLLNEFRRQTPPDTPTAALTQRERQILDLLAKGMSYKQIASELDISLGTVQSHIKNLYQKLQVTSKMEAVSKASSPALRGTAWNSPQ